MLCGAQVLNLLSLPPASMALLTNKPEAAQVITFLLVPLQRGGAGLELHCMFSAARPAQTVRHDLQGTWALH